MYRIWLRVALIGLIAFAIFILLNLNWRPIEQARPQSVTINQITDPQNFALKLDSNGIGTQVTNEGVAVTIKVSPYPIHKNVPFDISLVPLDARRQTLVDVEPTLLISVNESVSGAGPTRFEKLSDGSYIARQQRLTQNGDWRIRIYPNLPGATDFSILVFASIKE